MIAQPKRLWILNGDSLGQGPDTRSYQTTRAAVRGWRGWRKRKGHMVLITNNGPRDMTAEFTKLAWPDRQTLAQRGSGLLAKDPARQADLDHHLQVCLKNPDQCLLRTHVCAWTEYNDRVHKAENQDIIANAKIIEKLVQP